MACVCARSVAGKNLPVVVVGTKHEDGEERTVSQSEIDVRGLFSGKQYAFVVVLPLIPSLHIW